MAAIPLRRGARKFATSAALLKRWAHPPPGRSAPGRGGRWGQPQELQLSTAAPGCNDVAGRDL